MTSERMKRCTNATCKANAETRQEFSTEKTECPFRGSSLRFTNPSHAAGKGSAKGCGKSSGQKSLRVARRPFSRVIALILVVFSVMFPRAMKAQGRLKPGSQDAIDVPPFEVTSIRLVKSDTAMKSIRLLENGIWFTGVSTQILIRRAFGVEDDRIFGLPSWAKSDRYDIQARISEPDVPKWNALNQPQQNAALLPILTQRFNLKFHHEVRVIPIYVLDIDKGRSKLHEAKVGNTYINGLKGPDGVLGRAGVYAMTNGRVTGQGIPMEDLIFLLSNLQLGHAIVDKTGLAGRYDITLHWNSEGEPFVNARSLGVDSRSDDRGPDTDAPSLFTALREQLGLKLELKKLSMDVVVIDHIEVPSKN
jgi:uncharacterized protein (TIGR03435 family)